MRVPSLPQSDPQPSSPTPSAEFPKIPVASPHPPRHVETSAPGRLCLFGEHQDYLGLPVIAMAIDLRIALRGTRREDALFHLSMPDIGEELTIDPGRDLPHRHGRDYLSAGVNVLRREGIAWTRGYDITITSRIPVNSGTSSSSALQVAWMAFLLTAAGDARASDPECIARLAHRSEVTEFGAPGGMMDHYACAFGGLLHIDCREPVQVLRLPDLQSSFVLVSSGAPKATNETLGRVRRLAEEGFELLGVPRVDLGRFLQGVTPEGVPPLSPVERDAVVRANVRNFHLTRQALEILHQTPHNHAAIGVLMNTHHRQLSKHLRVSTRQIDDILHEGVRMGALGGKINGSGGGGTCFLMCPDNCEAVREHFDRNGYASQVVRCSEGLRVEAQGEA